MIKPIEFREDKSITLPNGETSTTAAVWAMLTASRNGDLDQIKQLLSKSLGLVTCEYNYTPPLHFAVREGHADVTRFLLECGADAATYKTYPFGDSLLTMARDRNYDEVAEILLQFLSRRAPVVEGLEDFFKGVRSGDYGRVKDELKRNPTLATAANETGDTALHNATEGNQLEVMLALLDSGADPDAQRANGIRPINCALRLRGVTPKRTKELADTLLTRGADYNIYIAAVLGDLAYVADSLARDPGLANFEDSSHAHPLSAAARRNDLEMVRLLLSHGANPSLPEAGAPLGEPLWIAVYQRQHEMARLLLEHGANSNTAPESSGSALLQARGDEELTRLLLQYGAKDDSGDMNELRLAIGDNDLVKIEELLKQHPDLARDETACWSEGILSGPASRNDLDKIELLFCYGARVPDVSKWGRYYYFKHYEAAQFLLERGMNPNHMNWHHVTLLHDMAQEGDIAKAKLLLDHGADINAVDEEYRSTPIGLASRWNNREMVRLLLDRGADPNKSGAAWATPVAWARKRNCREIESDLLAAGATT